MLAVALIPHHSAHHAASAAQNLLALLDELHGAPLLNSRAFLSTGATLTSTHNSVPDAVGPASPSAATAPTPLSSSTCALPRIDSWGGCSRHASPASWPGEEPALDNRSGEQGLGQTSQGTLGGVAASTPGLRHALEGGTADHRSPGQQLPHASSWRRSADSGLDAGQMQTLLHEPVHQRSPLQPLQQQGPPMPWGLGVKDTDIYYRRQLLIRTIEGRRVDLITITDCFGASGEVEAPPEGVLQPRADDGGGDAALFPRKKVRCSRAAHQAAVHGQSALVPVECVLKAGRRAALISHSNALPCLLMLPCNSCAACMTSRCSSFQHACTRARHPPPTCSTACSPSCCGGTTPARQRCAAPLCSSWCQW